MATSSRLLDTKSSRKAATDELNKRLKQNEETVAGLVKRNCIPHEMSTEVLSHLQVVAKLEANGANFVGILSGLAMALLAGGILGIPITVLIRRFDSIDLVLIGIALVVYAISLLIVTFVGGVPALVLAFATPDEGRYSFRSVSFSYVIWPVIVATVVATAVRRDLHFSWMRDQAVAAGIEAGMLSAAWILIVVALAVAAMLIEVLAREERTYTRRPQTDIIDEHCRLLQDFAAYPEEELALKKQNRILYRLERIAVRIEIDLPKAWNTGDLHTRQRVKESMRSIAAGYREMKPTLCLQGRGAIDNLATTIARNLRNIVAGNWEELPQLEPKRLTSKQRIIVLSASLRTLGLGFAPFAVLYLFQRISSPLEQEMLQRLSVSAYIWAIISILIAFDPLLGAKLSALKEALNAIGRGGSGGK